MGWWRKKTAAVTLMDAAEAKAKHGGDAKSATGSGLLSRLLKRGGKTQTSSDLRKRSPDNLSELDSVISHGDAEVVFGLRWQVLRKGERTKQQTAALKDGFTHVVVGVESDLIGFSRLSRQQRTRQPKYAGALLLSETVSLGGNEIFVFRLDEQRRALVALRNTQPVPGFDIVGDDEVIARAAQNFLSLPHQGDVRRCGDAEILSGAEVFDFAAALNGLESGQPVLKPLLDRQKLLKQGLIVGAALLVVVIAYLAWSYWSEKQQAERRLRESDPNLLYEQSLSTSASALRGLGKSGLRSMVDTLIAIPLEAGGWSLVSVACQPQECVATWTRNFGNYADFDANLPADVKQSPEYGFITSDARNVQLKTKHLVHLEQGASATFKRETLPSVGQVKAQFVSRLQDYALIEARASAGAPSLFPSGSFDIAAIFKPVVAGTWSLDMPLWSLQSIDIPDYVKVESLSVDVPPMDATKSVSDKSKTIYKLTGKYYAKGKDY